MIMKNYGIISSELQHLEGIMLLVVCKLCLKMSIQFINVTPFSGVILKVREHTSLPIILSYFANKLYYNIIF